MCFFFRSLKPKSSHLHSNMVEIEYITGNGNSKKQKGEFINLELDGDDDSGFYYVLTLKLDTGKNRKFKEYHLMDNIRFNGRRFSNLKSLKEYLNN